MFNQCLLCCNYFLLPLSQTPCTSKNLCLSSLHLPMGDEDSNKISLSLSPSLPETEQVLFSQSVSVHPPNHLFWWKPAGILNPSWVCSFLELRSGSHQLGYGLHRPNQKQGARLVGATKTHHLHRLAQDICYQDDRKCLEISNPRNRSHSLSLSPIKCSYMNSQAVGCWKLHTRWPLAQVFSLGLTT